jgi:hypothetical protein
MGAAGALGGRYTVAVGSPAEGLYVRDGFYGVEQGPGGPFRWTHAYAQVTVAEGGPGPGTLRLTLADASPTARSVWFTLDGEVIYRGPTQPGGTTWTLVVAGTAHAATPLIGIASTPWTPPGDSRALGVALLGLTVDTPGAALRGVLAEGALLLAVLVLVVAAMAGTGHATAPAVAGLGVLGFAGPLLAYGDPWLTVAAPVAAGGSLLAAALLRRQRGRGGSGAWGAAGWGTLALAAGLLLFTLARFNTGDAEAMYQITAGLALDGVPWAHQDHAWVKFGLGKPLLDLPLYEVGQAWARLTGGDAGGLTRFTVAWQNAGVTALTALVLFAGARRRYGSGTALALTGTWLLATPALTYARLAFAEPISTLLILGAVLLLLPLRPDVPPGYRPSAGAIFLAGLALGAAVLVKPANAIYLPLPALYLLWLLWRSRQPAQQSAMRLPQSAIVFGLGLLPGLALTAGYNALRYGTPFTFGYEQEGFTTPLLTGLYGLIFSPGKGIVWFAPPVVLGVVGLVGRLRGPDGRLRAEALLIAGQAAIVLGFHALWSSWEGNIAWGPRLILPIVPWLLWPLGALAGSVRARWGWWALGAAGFLVAIPGALIDQFYYFDINGVYKGGTEAERLMLFAPEWSQIVAHWRFLLTGTREAVVRPLLADFGLAAWGDVLVPGVLAGLAVAAVAGLVNAARHQPIRAAAALVPGPTPPTGPSSTRPAPPSAADRKPGPGAGPGLDRSGR